MELSKYNHFHKLITGDMLLTKNEIVNAAKPMSRISGVYFLILNSEIIYIGQSVNMYSRAASHYDKEFDSVVYMPCPKEDLNIMESIYIHEFKPAQNGKYKYIGWMSPVKTAKLNELIEARGI